ncbi:MAG: hypothetical protein VB055_06695 [Oscillospiraceae bacterium]|nr:hypothetical protein [Oscillospiraceae bacterium]
MNTLRAGFSRVTITPMMGIGIAGYYKPRFAEGVLDDLELNALALACGDTKAVLLSIDHCGIQQELSAACRKHVSEVTGLPKEAIYLSATHTHTAPFLRQPPQDSLEQEYSQFVRRKMADVAQFALSDLKPARMGWGIGDAPNIAFIRRFRMKDGSVKTNPGVRNPDIAAPLGEVDKRVNVLRFDQEGGEHLILVNFGDHPDTVGGNKISADWPGFLRRTVEKTLDHSRCIFFNGAEGDVNHVNVHPKGGDLNDMFMDFDDVSRGYGHARHMGRVVAAATLQAFDKVQYVDVDTLRCLQRTIQVPSNMPNPADLPEARRLNELHEAGKDAKIPYTGMMLTTVVAEAARMLRLEHGPDAFSMELTGIGIGPVAMAGIPGEPFTGIGRALKETAGWDLVLPTCNTNGDEGYFPMRDAYEEGGYEARSSNFKAGVAELMVAEGQQMLNDLRDTYVSN